MKSKTITKSPGTSLVVELHAQHIRFHSFLDRLAAKTNDPDEIELLIELRQLNINCMSSYADLIARDDIKLNQPKPQASTQYQLGLKETNMTLWNIHAQLARFVPVYVSVLRDKQLNKVAKLIISNNYDRIILMKDNLLHPLPQLVATAAY